MMATTIMISTRVKPEVDRRRRWEFNFIKNSSSRNVAHTMGRGWFISIMPINYQKSRTVQRRGYRTDDRWLIRTPVTSHTSGVYTEKRNDELRHLLVLSACLQDISDITINKAQ